MSGVRAFGGTFGISPVEAGGTTVECFVPQTDVPNSDERTWLTRHHQGDESAFPALLQAYGPRVLSYVARCGVAEPDRDDICQTVFLKIHCAAGTYDPRRPLGPWVFTIAVNTVRDHFRAGSVRPAPASDSVLPELSDPNPSPEHVAAARETVSWLEQALFTLPLAQREVLILSTVLGMPQQDVAQTLNLPLNTVKTHLRRARLKLADAMEERETQGRPGVTDDEL